MNYIIRYIILEGLKEALFKEGAFEYVAHTLHLAQSEAVAF
jgi:hypothetical protein